MPDAIPLLRASSLRFSYGIRPAVQGVSVSLAAGEFVAVLGPNGSGKSTLMKLLLGQLRGEGDVAWEGKPLREWPRRELARRLAYLPQNPAYDPDQTVADVIRLGRAPYWGAFGLETRHDLQVVTNIVAELGLQELVDRGMNELSGGQRQRVFIGRCLAQEPAAMLLDEPNTFLDLKHQVELCTLLKALTRERSIGVLMASHDLNLAGAFADRLILLHEGGVAADGGADVVFREELLSRVYGLPIRRIEGGGGISVVVPVG